jgi:hypothetical protein
MSRLEKQLLLWIAFSVFFIGWCGWSALTSTSESSLWLNRVCLFIHCGLIGFNLRGFLQARDDRLSTPDWARDFIENDEWETK